MSELEGFKVLPVAPIITYSEVEFDLGFRTCFREPDLGIVFFNSQLEFCLHFERPRIAYNMFDQMPESSGLYRYALMPKNVTAHYFISHLIPVQQLDLLSENVQQDLVLAIMLAIWLSNVEGKLWVSESGQKLYMEFGSKMFNIKPAKDIFAAVPCPNRAVTTPQSTQGI